MERSRPHPLRLASTVVVTGLAVVACSGPPPKRPQQAETVAVNSGLESSASMPPLPSKSSPSSAGGGDSAAGLAAALAGAAGGGGGGMAGMGGSDGGSSPDPKDAKDAKDGGKDRKDVKDDKKKDDSPRATKAECERAMDKGIDLEFAGQAAQLRGVMGDAGIAKAVQEAKQRNRRPDPKNPCNEKNDGITKNQFTCAIAARTKPAWVKCMEN